MIAADDGPVRVPFALMKRWRKRAAQWLVGKAFGGGARDNAETLRLPRAGIHRILVCRISHTLGNTLLLTPLICELGEVYPGAEIDVVTRYPAAEEIFGNFDRIRRIYRLPRHGVSALWRLVKVLRAIRSNRYDLAIDTSACSQSDRAYVMLADAARKVGFASKDAGALTHLVPVPTEVRHVGQLPVHLLRSALGREGDVAYPPLSVDLTPDERVRGKRTLERLVGGDRPVLGIFTLATGRKHLGAEWWGRFVSRVEVLRPGLRIVELISLVGGSMLEDRYPAFYSSDIRVLAAVLSGLSWFVSADCGVMHLACASGTPTFGLFRGTNIAEWGPYGERDRAVDVSQQSPEDVADTLLGGDVQPREGLASRAA